MSASFRLGIATRGFRGGTGEITETIYIDQALKARADYDSFSIDIDDLETTIRIDLPVTGMASDVNVDVEIEGSY
jgi:hypothetical protein